MLFLLALALLGGAVPVRACNIPVFRFALDHWPSDPYRLTIFHRGPLAAEHRDSINALRKHASGNHPAVTIEIVDLASKPAGAEGEIRPPERAKLPWLVVRYPAATRIETPVWSGPLQSSILKGLLNSPDRHELARRIRDGDSAVWVLLAGGDAKKDAAAEQLLRKEVQRLEKELKLPTRTLAPEDKLSDNQPLKLAFSVLRVSRKNPLEEMLVRMLLNTEGDLPGRSDPMVFPVYGRGRVMPALVGAGITPANIEEAATFLAGPCSCEVKRDNPGVDLLMTMDWGRTAASPVASIPIVAGTPVPIPRQRPAPPASAPPSASEPPSASTHPFLLAGIGIAGLFATFSGVMLLRSRRRRRQ